MCNEAYEAGLERAIDKANDMIERLRAENEKLRDGLAEYIAQAERGHQTMVAEACELRKEIHKLRAALKPFAETGECESASFSYSYLRAAAAALKETGDE